MFKYAFSLLVCLAPALSQAQSVVAHNLASPVTKDVAYLTQEVLLSGETSTSMSVAPLTTSNMGFGVKKLSTKMAGTPVGGLPVISVSNPTTTTQALAAATQWMDLEMPVMRKRMSDWMSKKGISVGFYNYTQEIMVQTIAGVKKQAIGFNASIDISGRGTYGKPKIVNPDPLVLEAIYSPLKTEEGLPSNWKYPDAGTVKYRVLNKKFEPLSAWASVNVNGAYDEDSDGNSRVQCLMDSRAAGCTGGTSDINQLLAATGASYGLVSYIRKIQPDYTTDSQGNATPTGAISVDSRVWNCTSYTNKGHYGFVLALMADQYLAEPTDNLVKFSLVQSLGGKGISPTEPYEKTVPVTALNGVHPDTVIIAPTPGDDTLWSRSDAAKMKNVVYVAPVVASGADGEITEAAFSGDMAVRLISSSETSRDYYIGTVADNYWGSGVYDRSVTFNLKDPGATEMFSIIQTGFDDWLLVQVNGTTVYIGPRGGNMLEVQSGVHQDNCSYSGGSYVCGSYDPGKWVSAATYVDESGTPSCPAGSMYGYGTTPYLNWSDGWGDYSGYGCFTASTAKYANCEPQSYWSGDTEVSSGYLCTQGCSSGMVQYLQGARGYGSGCGWPELSTSWNFNTNIDLRPYLKSGANTIFTRTIVAGGGESWLRIRTQMCGASMNLGTTAPPVPVTGGAGGVGNTLLNQAQP